MDADLTIFREIPLEFDVLKEAFRAYRSPKDKIARMAANSELIRIKKGLYVNRPSAATGLVCLELVANWLYGPSYVSRETALMYHGMIPEMVLAVRSMAVKRRKVYRTPLGVFDYTTVPKDYFAVGISREERNGYSFLIASPEKALCDVIIATSGIRIQSVKAMREYIEEDMRIDLTEIRALDSRVFEEAMCADIKRREIALLRKVVLHG